MKKNKDQVEILRMLKDLSRAIELIADDHPDPGRSSGAIALCQKTTKKAIELYQDLENE